jgi:hypothetical protein
MRIILRTAFGFRARISFSFYRERVKTATPFNMSFTIERLLAHG